jgi:molybdopterin molybdotransferase
MISVDKAINLIADNVTLTNAEDVPIKQCLGRVLAEDVASKLSYPPVAVSSMDGYALNASDTANPPVSLKLIGVSQAGGSFESFVGSGETVRIFTGAPLPPGADAVQMQENAEIQGNHIKIIQSVATNNFVRAAGMDFAAGDILIKAGTVLSARHIGLAAAMNRPTLSVRRKPRVAILATGNEVALPGTDLRPSQIITSNSFALYAYVVAMGGNPIDLGIAGDTLEELGSSIEGAFNSDVLVTIGGVSVGDYDLVGQALREKGLRQEFHKIAMRPGKPLLFGNIDNLSVLCMPGNPVSTGVCSVLFLKKALYTMLGIKTKNEPALTAILGQDMAENDLRQDYVRAKLEINDIGERIAQPFLRQDSAMQACFTEADCLIVRMPHAPSIKAGELVSILLFSGSLISL